ncbi:TPA: patatin-like phospholipase family protein [Pasteurella multocida]|uniref:CBASS cGAMP-activated phospholipase n=1 Tax=Pasteurella multocida TaxID=747 RepID=UPI002021CE58|nr:CBASS cGAMP-activated phospholipase [Pasteurella multocida]MCL7796808.1 patatin-like phospholipase family protein [Pasteurella multocida]MCL7802582.1 patatin-like phospholipase family protein [Pasteurella multocida]MDG2540615.1 CBASS cGAMP-activated phospholipase [Pasteurella multocida]MDY0498290.1 patatin-like phospholipase family protein [Pasteurella multocida]MDY0655147.1 patatin-like phospholipase family protein [Pasteurella multocida]
MKNQSDFKILSLSGGGYRGLYTAEVLKELENHLKAKNTNDCIANYFNLITGTSIGGIIALALAYEIPAEKIAKIFDDKGEEIFKKQSCIGMFKAKYNSDILKDILVDWFGDALIGDLKHPVVIPAVDYTTGNPVAFKTAHHDTFKRDWKQKIVDVALATSAAPTYFKRHRIGENEYIDGGLFANSPSLVGLHEAEIFFEYPINQVKILSIGTLSSKKTINPKTNKKGGLSDWGEGNVLKSASNIIDITLSSQQLFMNQLVKHRLKDNLVVIDENLTQSSAPYVGLDNATIWAKQILKGNASQSSKVALGKTEVLAFFDEIAIPPVFYEGK